MARMISFHETEYDDGTLGGALVSFVADNDDDCAQVWISADEAHMLVRMLIDTFDLDPADV
jgi:hypothetical protein